MQDLIETIGMRQEKFIAIKTNAKEPKKKFCARIGLDGRSIFLGSFCVLGDADSAYRIAEEKYFGKFARNTILPPK